MYWFDKAIVSHRKPTVGAESDLEPQPLHIVLGKLNQLLASFEVLGPSWGRRMHGDISNNENSTPPTKMPKSFKTPDVFWEKQRQTSMLEKKGGIYLLEGLLHSYRSNVSFTRPYWWTRYRRWAWYDPPRHAMFGPVLKDVLGRHDDSENVLASCGINMGNNYGNYGILTQIGWQCHNNMNWLCEMTMQNDYNILYNSNLSIGK